MIRSDSWNTDWRKDVEVREDGIRNSIRVN